VVTDQLVSREELIEAVHDASIEYIHAEKVFQDFQTNMGVPTPATTAKLRELKRNALRRAQTLRSVQTQLLLSK
jgi:hypothetical protein